MPGGQHANAAGLLVVSRHIHVAGDANRHMNVAANG